MSARDFLHTSPDVRGYETCGCSLGLPECNCCGMACELPEPEPEAEELGFAVVRWVAPILFVLVVAALAAGVFEDEFWRSSAPSSVEASNTAGAVGASRGEQ